MSLGLPISCWRVVAKTVVSTDAVHGYCVRLVEGRDHQSQIDELASVTASGSGGQVIGHGVCLLPAIAGF